MGGRGGGRLITFSAFRMSAYSRWALSRGWALIRINTVFLCFIKFGDRSRRNYENLFTYTALIPWLLYIYLNY